MAILKKEDERVFVSPVKDEIFQKTLKKKKVIYELIVTETAEVITRPTGRHIVRTKVFTWSQIS